MEAAQKDMIAADGEELLDAGRLEASVGQGGGVASPGVVHFGVVSLEAVFSDAAVGLTPSAADVLTGRAKYHLWFGDNLTLLRSLPSESIDVCFTDPPYGLGRQPKSEELLAYFQGADLALGDFMGRDWSLPPLAVWREVYRAMKPGGHVLVCAGTRTLDVMSVGLRMAGFVIRDTISGEGVLRWYHGQGFPKSKALLKPCWEPLIMACKPGPMQLLDVDAGRVSTTDKISIHSANARKEGGWDTYGDFHRQETHQTEGQKLGRFPPNAAWFHLPDHIACSGCGAVVSEEGESCPTCGGAEFVRREGCRLVGSTRVEGQRPVVKGADTAPGGYSGMCRRQPGDIVGHADEDGFETVDDWHCAPGCYVAKLADQSGVKKSGSRKAGVRKGLGYHGADGDGGPAVAGSEGTAARFFPQFPGDDFRYLAKPARADRDLGCEDMLWAVDESRPSGVRPVLSHEEWEQLPPKQRRKGNPHITVKGQKWCEWILGMFAQPGQVVLDVYAGSGSIPAAALRKGCRVIAAEIDHDYWLVADARMKHAAGT